MNVNKKQLPNSLAAFFWECDFGSLSWEDQRDFIIRRILQAGSWDAITWLRAEIGDPELRHWLERRDGAGLSPRQLRFWGVVLDLPRPKVTRWVRRFSANPWQRRLTGEPDRPGA